MLRSRPLPSAGKILLALWPLAAVAIGMLLLKSAWTAILLYHLGLLCGLACSVRSGRSWRSLLDSGDKGPRTRDFALEIALAAAMGLVAYASVRIALPWLVGQEAELLWDGMSERLAVFGLQGASLVAFAFYFVSVHPLLEEAVWRGPLLGRDERSLRWEDGTFALYHLPVLNALFPGAWPLLAASALILTGAAWFWRQRARIDGGVRQIAIQHAFADVGILAAVLAG